MPEMSREEFLNLQREAEARMREMQRRSEEMVGRIPPTPDFVKLRETQNSQKTPENKTVQKMSAPPTVSRQNILQMLNFKNINMDSDRVLILALLLLMGDSCDELLLFALLYLML